MHRIASLLLPLVVLFWAGCANVRLGTRPVAPAPQAGATMRAIAPSPRLVVGRVLAIDARQQFAFIDIGSDAPPAALQDGAELVSRTMELRETAQLRASRYVRGRTLGATVISGQPSPGDEVVWLAP